MSRWVFAAAALTVPVAVLASADVPGTLKPASAFAGIASKDARSAAIFTEMGKVIQSPRCQNCHPRTDSPTQGDAMKLHSPPVTRGPEGHGAAGLECATCHGAANFTLPNGAGSVPGDPNWHLAPIEMAWQGKSLHEICEQIKDPARNGGKTLAQLVEHNGNDHLVGWGWRPGVGRVPAAGTQAQFGALTQAWVDSGAKCPG